MQNNKQIKRAVILAIIVVVVLFAGYKLLNRDSGSAKGIASSSSSNNDTSIAPAKATVEINKPFTFDLPVTLAKNGEKITFTILTAERKDEIKIKGEGRKAGSGKDYLLIRLELNNPSTSRIKFTSADFIRLASDGGKKFAPDYHNGAVTIDPISVRKDLIAFVVDKNAKKFSFQIGELEKEKQQVEIEFQ